MDTKKVVINKGLSVLVLTSNQLKRYMELTDKSFYYYKRVNRSEYQRAENGGYTDITDKYFGEFYKPTNNNDEIYNSFMRCNKYFEELSREDENLIKVVEEINEDDEKVFSALKIVEIPKDVKYYICEYECANGEYICEEHRSWH